MKTFFRFTLLLLISLTSCKQATEKQFNLDLDAPQGYQDLKFSDIIEDMRFVALETNDDCLVSPESRTYVSSKYIIASNNNEIHLFDADGKHLRKLIVKGHGPEEFNTISGLLIDDQRDILYYTDINDRDDNSKIRRVDLKSGKHIEPIVTKYNSLRYLDSKGNIWGAGSPQILIVMSSDSPEKDTTLPVLVTKWSPDSEEFQNFYASKGIVNPNSMNISLVGYKDEATYINLSYSDTLFSINKKGEMSPLHTLALADVSNDPLQSSSGVSLSSQYKDGIILSKTKKVVDITRSGGNINSISIMSAPSEYLHIDGNGALKKFRSMYIDPLDYKVDIELYSKSRNDNTIEKSLFSPFLLINGNYGYIRFDTYKIMDRYQELKEQGSVDKKVLDALEQICNKIEEDGNPVYLIGKVR